MTFLLPLKETNALIGLGALFGEISSPQQRDVLSPGRSRRSYTQPRVRSSPVSSPHVRAAPCHSHLLSASPLSLTSPPHTLLLTVTRTFPFLPSNPSSTYTLTLGLVHTCSYRSPVRVQEDRRGRHGHHRRVQPQPPVPVPPSGRGAPKSGGCGGARHGARPGRHCHPTLHAHRGGGEGGTEPRAHQSRGWRITRLHLSAARSVRTLSKLTPHPAP